MSTPATQGRTLQPAVDAVEHLAVGPEIELAGEVVAAYGQQWQVRRGQGARRALVGPRVVDVAEIVVDEIEAPAVDEHRLDDGLLGRHGGTVVAQHLRVLGQEVAEVEDGAAASHRRSRRAPTSR
jgi:hypothetical protein